MGLLHIANTNFEDELRLQAPASMNAVHLQLQFLPLLYAKEEDGIGVTDLPVGDYPAKFHLLSEKSLPYNSVESWGAARSIADWASSHGLVYKMPPWEVVRAVNSKQFSFTYSHKLPGAMLLSTRREVEEWIKKSPGPKVLKSCFGVAGRGHLHLPCNPKKIAALNLPVIGEPWVSRSLDFSTQWNIDSSIEYLGATLCICDAKGRYLENRAGHLNIPHLDRHKEVALPILQTMMTLGFFGNVGIDAFIYGDDQLHPIVEINARKTMGFVALKMQQRHFHKQTISLRYISGFGTRSLLPQHIVRADGTHLQFYKQLVIDY